ncbi:MAG TPA: hypothetical protein VF013_05240 [Candidatus Limnocylindria bacterium]
MPERSPAPSARPLHEGARAQVPPPDVVAFIRYCHRRREVGWPEIYDEMCAVAARREFNGWDHEACAQRGISFTLGEMPRLAAWVRAVVGIQPEPAVEGSTAAVVGSTA